MLQPERRSEEDRLTCYLRAANVQNGHVVLSDVKSMYCPPGEARLLSLRKGDLLVCEGGDVGRAAMLTVQPDEALIFQNSVHRVVARDGVAPRFLYYVLSTLYAEREYYGVLCNAATIRHLTVEKLRAIRVPFPPMDEQVAIARFLDREIDLLDEGLVLTEAQSDLASEHDRAALRNLALGIHASEQMQQTHHEWMPEIPSSWRVARLRYEARLESGHTPSRTRPELWLDCAIPWVSLNDVGSMVGQEFISVTADKISDAGVAASSARVLPAGTVVLSRDATIGRSSIMATPMATSQHFADFVCGDGLSPRYLWLLFTYVMQDYFESLTDGATLRTIGMGDLRNFVIPLPPRTAQDEIVRSATSLRERGHDLQNDLAARASLLRERRHALITAAVSGQFDVTTARSVA